MMGRTRSRRTRRNSTGALHHPLAQLPLQLLDHLQQLGAGAGVGGAVVGVGGGAGVGGGGGGTGVGAAVVGAGVGPPGNTATSVQPKNCSTFGTAVPLPQGQPSKYPWKPPLCHPARSNWSQ